MFASRSGTMQWLAVLVCFAVVVTITGCDSAVFVAGAINPNGLVIFVSVSSGVTQQLTAQATFTNGTTKDVTDSGMWSSSDPTIATISQTGMATFLANGTVTFTFTFQGLSKSVTLNSANSAALQSLNVTPQNPMVNMGSTVQLMASGQMMASPASFMSDLTKSVTWSSSNPAVAIVSATGMVGAVAPGTAVITATLNNVSASVTVTVQQGMTFTSM